MRNKITITADVIINGRRVAANSPTETLKDDIVTELGTCVDTIGYIDKICLVDDSGTERDCTTDLAYTDNAPDNVTVKGSIQASAAYNVAKIRAYSGSKIYFETSYSISLSQGDVLDVTYQISASVSCSLSGSVTQSSCEPSGFINALLRKLIQPGASTTPPTLCLKRANLMCYDSNTGQYQPCLTIDLTLSYDTGTNQVSGSGSATSSIQFNAVYLMYDNGAQTPADMIEQYFDQQLPIYNGTVVNVNYTLTVS